MELILWRHADAEETRPDLDRELTDKGRKQAARVADWVTLRLPPDIRILVSPAIRAVQTAQALGRNYEIVPALAPGARVEDVLSVAGWPNSSHPVMIVGHQPTLGQVAMFLLSGQTGDLTVKKAGIWWFQNRGRMGEMQAVLRAVAVPDWL
ncbi:MAG TPA: phosphohistidine phosphatase SixA [Thiobacillus sp.]